MNTGSFDGLAAAVRKDIECAVETLEDILSQIGTSENADIEPYRITVHGLRSALANIDETELSNIALNLEQAGIRRELTEISTITPDFIVGLRSLLEKLERRKTVDEVPYEDKAVMINCLKKIKADCAIYNINGIETELNILDQKTWSSAINTLLDELNLYLLGGELKKITAAAEKIEAIL